MTYEEFLQKLEDNNIEQIELLKELNISPQSLTNWKRRGVPYWVESWLNHYIKRKQYFNEMLKQNERLMLLLQIITELIKLCKENKINSNHILEKYNFQELIQELKEKPFSFVDLVDNENDEKYPKTFVFSISIPLKEAIEKTLNSTTKKQTITHAREIVEEKAPFLSDGDKEELIEEIASKLQKEHQEAEHYKHLTQELEKLKKEFEEIKKKIDGDNTT